LTVPYECPLWGISNHGLCGNKGLGRIKVNSSLLTSLCDVHVLYQSIAMVGQPRNLPHSLEGRRMEIELAGEKG